ncbi:hypothetical protein sscle_01g005250 [Sclerotinia sclerotiorum 1980 UF-70]|uniref:Pentacotripeptide-repeat region of PRORP domain-containing protein n=2 Tax=Sclerotinia sclerotiorum (strain ATCC 18683 / 1980 / Ss-1) TaxID=665079 RepID=A0A1D9PSQ3_SCLS1|nr:hypothetical protein sscle_01g005250 [Sclerotinia sclerotiorum 1980 UF-70]
MLERTAGCLETGSLRRLLPGPKHLVKSRRTLHSGFWSHGAIELELSPLWQLMLQGTNVFENSNLRSPRDGTSSENPGVSLDFLYPAGTLKFLRQYSGLGVDRKAGKRTRLGLRSSGYRLYTSSAKSPSLALVPVDVEKKETVEIKKRSMIPEVPDDAATIATVLGITTSSRYEEVWRKYRRLELGSWAEERIRIQVLEYMAASNRIVDAERATSLFERCDERREKPEIYEIVIRTYLRLQNFSRANELYQYSLEKFNTTAGGSDIMLHLMTNSLWPQAFTLWTEVQLHDNLAGPRYDIFKSLHYLEDLPSKALHLAQYINKSIRISSQGDSMPSEALTKFGTEVIASALLSAKHFSYATFWPLVKHVQKWGSESVSLYAQATRILINLGQSKAAVVLYRQARESPKKNLMLPRSMLHSVLQIFFKNHDLIGIQEVFTDIFRFNQNLDRNSYRRCMDEFARHGDADTVHAMFEQFAERYMRLESQSATAPNPLASADDMAPLLHVHARRGEYERVVEIFKSIRQKYRLKPTIICCNILISAYAQVSKYDNAFETFEYTVNKRNLQPDDYTFGTLMGMCASRGDLENTIELYRMSASYGVEKSAAMVSTLVTAYLACDRLGEAETICEEAVNLNFKDSRTRMWNSLLVAWALRYDLVNVNRILQRMSQLDIEHNGDTYAALMQALSMVGQPERAWEILVEVMPEAGIPTTSLHYAIVMGGFLATHRYDDVFRVQNRMLEQKRMKNASTKFMELRSAIHEARRRWGDAQGAMEIFEQVVGTMNPRDLSDKVRKGIQHEPLDIAYPATCFGYIIFVLSKNMETNSAKDMHQRFLRMLPEDRRGIQPQSITTALMSLKLQELDYGAVEDLWMQFLSDIRTRHQPLRLPGSLSRIDDPEKAEMAEDDVDHSSKEGKGGGSKDTKLDTQENKEQIMAAHRFALAKALHFYMIALLRQGKINIMIRTVNEITDLGFQLSNQNWNEYIQHLARARHFKLAFKTCESVLMENWKGWAKLRAQTSEKNRLPLEIRRKGKLLTSLRPEYRTFLHLTRGFLSIQAMAAESRANRLLLNDLEHDCSRTLTAIKTMVKAGDSLEWEILGE